MSCSWMPTTAAALASLALLLCSLPGCGGSSSEALGAGASLLEDVEDEEEHIWPLVYLAKGYTARGHKRMATKFAGRAKEACMTSDRGGYASTFLAPLLVVNGDLEGAQALAAALGQRAEEDDSYAPYHVGTLNGIVQGLFQQQRYDEGLEVAKEALAAPLALADAHLRREVFTLVLDTFDEAHEAGDADLASKMLEFGTRYAPVYGAEGVLRNRAVAMAEKGDTTTALLIIEGIRSDATQMRGQLAIAKIMTEHGDLPSAEALFTAAMGSALEAEENKLDIDMTGASQFMDQLASMQAEMDKQMGVQSVSQASRQRFTRANALAQAGWDLGFDESARQLTDVAEELAGHDVRMLVDLADTLLLADDADRCERALRRARSSLGRFAPTSQRVEIAELYGRVGKSQQGIAMLDELARKLDPITDEMSRYDRNEADEEHALLARGYASCGDLDKATALAIASEDAVGLVDIALVLADAGHDASANEILTHALSSETRLEFRQGVKIVRNSSTRDRTDFAVPLLVQTRMDCFDWGETLKAYEFAGDGALYDDVLVAALSACDASSSLSTVGPIVDSGIRAGKREATEAFLDRRVAAATAETDPADRAAHVSLTAALYEELGIVPSSEALASLEALSQ